MDLAKIYAVFVGGFFAILTTIQFVAQLVQAIRSHGLILFRQFVYPVFVRRHYILGPWARYGSATRLLYLGLNAFCAIYKISSRAEASLRTGQLSLINLMPLYFGLHLGFLADVLGISSDSCRALHATTGIVTAITSFLHVILSTTHATSDKLQKSRRVFGLVVSRKRISAIWMLNF